MSKELKDLKLGENLVVGASSRVLEMKLKSGKLFNSKNDLLLIDKFGQVLKVVLVAGFGGKYLVLKKQKNQ